MGTGRVGGRSAVLNPESSEHWQGVHLWSCDKVDVTWLIVSILRGGDICAFHCGNFNGFEYGVYAFPFAYLL